MIRANTTDVEVLTTLGADRLQMGIDEDGLVQICDLLTNMYSDEELAVLREYSTNAYDSHIAAGCPERPIEITLPCGVYDIPSAEKGRFLRIKDYGTGLSVEEIATIYSRYGKSTKDRSNEQQGFMGIGGKSGLVETFGSFKITAVKDGEKAIVMVGRDESGAPVMDLASVTETDEPNGVEVELPVTKHNRLERKAANLFQFWIDAPVLVDGKEPAKLQPKVKVTDNIWIVDGLYSKNQRTDFIVMGNVPYPIQLDAKLSDGHSLVIFVPIGAVMPTPSRESLRMTPETKAEIARLTAEYDQQVQTTIQRNVDAAPSKFEAVKTMLKWRSVFASNADLHVTYKGQKMPMKFEVPNVWADGDRKGIVVAKAGASKPSDHSRYSEIFIGTLVDAVLVHGYPARKFVAVHKQKLEKWAEEKGLDPKHYVLTEKRLAHGWIGSAMRVDWETVKAVKVTHTTKNGVVRPKGSYDMYLAGDYQTGVEADQIPLDEAIFYMEKNFFSYSGGYYGRTRTKRQVMFEHYPNATFVELTPNRVNKFKRDFPMARHAQTIMQEVYADFKTKVVKRDLLRLAVEDAYDAHTLSKLDPQRVDDPAVRKAIRLAKRPLNKELREGVRTMRYLVGAHVVDNDSDLTVKWVNPLDKYPLVDTNHLEHTYLYINAAYAADRSDK